MWRRGLWEWLGSESGALMNRISAFLKEAPERSRIPSTLCRCSEKDCCLWPSKWGSPNHTCWCLGLPHLQNGEDTFLLFTSHPGYGVLLQQSRLRDTALDSRMKCESTLPMVRPWLHGSLHVLKEQRVFYNWKFHRNLISKKRTVQASEKVIRDNAFFYPNCFRKPYLDNSIYCTVPHTSQKEVILLSASYL